jgi:DNA-directed RNA polymerase alpha subunit
MSDEAKDILRFFDSFSTGTQNVLKQNGVHKKADLMELIEKTNLIDVPRVGKVAREEILRFLERGFYDEN